MDNVDGNIPQGLEDRLLKIASRLVPRGGAEEAGDIVQEAKITLWKLGQQGYGIRNAESLAVRLVRNIGISHYRRKKLLTEPVCGDDYPDGTTAEDALAGDEIELTKRKLYGHLSDTERRYIRLRTEYGMSLDEIAERTGRPKTSVKSSLSRARRKMLEELKKDI